ncbi:uncharacterized protein LOC127700892 [Mytilus californianus]|uniref:uncharacterized protein LOC127700892 n=1 Tax=Mytilus californianus TaxID=6549 RepID=UPI00224687A5|nr:uncharacterized protein LOC127700892 [Mytilus californianus]
MGNCAQACGKHGICLKKRPKIKRTMPRIGTLRPAVQPSNDRRVGWRENLVDEDKRLESKLRQGSAKFNTDDELPHMDNVDGHRKRKKRRKKKDLVSDENRPFEMRSSQDSNDYNNRQNQKPRIDILGKRHSISPHYNKEKHVTNLLFQPMGSDIDDQNVHHRKRKRKKKHKLKDKAGEDSLVMVTMKPTGQFLTDDTVIGDPDHEH